MARPSDQNGDSNNTNHRHNENASTQPEDSFAGKTLSFQENRLVHSYEDTTQRFTLKENRSINLENLILGERDFSHDGSISVILEYTPLSLFQNFPSFFDVTMGKDPHLLINNSHVFDIVI